jgi:hypothetical protein
MRASPPSPVPHASYFRDSDLCLPVCGLDGIGRQPRVHYFQPGGRRLWRRPVPGERRQMRGPRRPFLLSIAEFRRGYGLSKGRSGRGGWLGSDHARKMRPCRLQGIHRYYLPTLKNRSALANLAVLAPRKGRAAAEISGRVACRCPPFSKFMIYRSTLGHDLDTKYAAGNRFFPAPLFATTLLTSPCCNRAENRNRVPSCQTITFRVLGGVTLQ